MTKITFNRDELFKCLKKAKDVVEKKPILAVLGDLLFIVDGQKVTIVASDLELTLLMTMQIEESMEPIKFLMPFEFTYKTVELMDIEKVTFEVKKKSASIVGFTDRYDVGSLSNPDDFPKVPEMPEAKSLHVGKEFAKWASNVQVALDKSAPIGHFTTMICADVCPGKVILVGASTRMLVKKGIAIEHEETERLVLRSKIVKAIAEFEELDINWSKNHVSFTSGNTLLFATRPDCEYPDYNRVIPAAESNLKLMYGDALKALKKVSLTSGSDSSCALFLQAAVGNVIFKSEDDATKLKAAIEIPGTYTGEVDKILFNPDFMQSIIGHLQSNELELAITSPSRPILVKTNEDPEFLGLVMPRVEK